MRRLFLGLVFLVGLTGAVWAQSDEIEGVITSQIEAFKADDFVTAFTFASPSIQGLFGDPGTFGRMVRGGYPMVWRPAEVTYLDLREVEGDFFQKVRIVDGAGAVHFLMYQMVRVGADFRINGVQLLKNAGTSA